jgi:hypothetical protein
MTSTAEGMQIEQSAKQHEKAKLSIRDSLEPAGKVTLERFWHHSKHLCPITSTFEGIQIEESEEHCVKADLSIRDSAESV